MGSSYGAFMAPLGHIAARLHCIGAQARQAVSGEPYKPMVLICAHAGLKTGEDGPTHADPQALQLLQEDFPRGTAVTLTPWEPQEVWPLLATALAQRPAADRAVRHAAQRDRARQRRRWVSRRRKQRSTGVYLLRAPEGEADVTVVLQESAVAYAFVEEALPLLAERGLDARVYYVASAELFDALSEEERSAVFPDAHAREAMGVTGFTLPTMWRWITSAEGRAATLHPFAHGHYLGSGQGDVVLAEAGLDGASQAEAIVRYAESRRRT